MRKPFLHVTLVFLACTFHAMSADAIAAPAGSVPRLTLGWDSGWLFSRNDSALSMVPRFDDSGWRSVRVPHDWSTEEPFRVDYGSGNGYVAGGVGWYRKHFSLDARDKDRLVIVEFDGVYNHAQIWINGQFVGGRPYGYSSFQIDLTRYVDFGRDNVIAVRVDHSRYADSRFYTGSGIYRHVRLCLPTRLHIGEWGTFVTTPRVTEDAATVHVGTDVVNAENESREFQLRADIVGADGNVVASSTATATVAQGQTVNLVQELNVAHPGVWSIESPVLYTLRNTVSEGGREIDQTETPFGIRTIQFDPNHGFLLNGKAVKMMGVCLHHDAGSLGAAVPDQVLERRLRLLRDIGVNAIRTSHNPPAPELLSICDRLGFVVMDEAFDEFTPAKNKWIEGWTLGVPGKYGYAEDFLEWSVRDMEDLVRRDRNHPCVVIWSIGNEVDTPNDPYSDPVLGGDFHPHNPPASELVRLGSPLIAAAKRFDRTRPVTSALASVKMSDAVGFGSILDIAGYNYQELRYPEDHAKFPNRVIYGSENRHDYRAWLAVRDNEYVSGQFLWTGIDYLGEAGVWPNRASGSGLLDLCGFKKPLGWFRQSLWSVHPMVYLSASAAGSAKAASTPKQGAPVVDRERRSPSQELWNWQQGSSVDVTCYSNCDSVQLLLNGKEIGTKRMADALDGVLDWSVPFQPGTLRAVGWTNGRRVSEFTLQTTGPAARVELVPDAITLPADGASICHLEYQIVDKDGHRIVDAELPVAFEVRGPINLLGLGSGDLSNLEDPHALTHHTFQGRGLAILQARNSGGAAHIRATSPGLQPAEVDFTVSP
jgi:beta-galactosidase